MGKSKHLLAPENKDILEHFQGVIDSRFEKIMIKHEHPKL